MAIINRNEAEAYVEYDDGSTKKGTDKKPQLLKLDEYGLLQSFVMSEVLGKPKAKRRKVRYEGINSRR